MPRIKDIYAKEILDSRGNPTVEVTITSTNIKPLLFFFILLTLLIAIFINLLYNINSLK